jgi:hypothetical protein
MERYAHQTIPAGIYNHLSFIDIDAFREKIHVLRTYPKWGTLRGDKGGDCGDQWFIDCTVDSASPPWGWNDVDDDPVYGGEMALDPAHLVDHYFDGLGAFSPYYLRNPYLENLQDLRSQHGAAWTPTGWPDQLDLETLVNKLITSCAYYPPPPPDDPVWSKYSNSPSYRR